MNVPWKTIIVVLVLALLGRGTIAFVEFLRAHSQAYVEAHVPDENGRVKGCAHLYNVDKHKEWADCMGVGYK